VVPGPAASCGVGVVTAVVGTQKRARVASRPASQTKSHRASLTWPQRLHTRRSHDVTSGCPVSRRSKLNVRDSRDALQRRLNLNEKVAQTCASRTTLIQSRRCFPTWLFTFERIEGLWTQPSHEGDMPVVPSLFRCRPDESGGSSHAAAGRQRA
jgi:hypothetical protein